MRIKEIRLLTGDLDNTIHFYREVIGLEIKHVGERLVSFQSGLSVLTFIEAKELAPVYHFAFNIPTNQFDAALEWAVVRLNLLPIKAEDYIADFKNWNARAFYFYDNSYNIVEMIARFDLNNASATPFNGKSIASISEIGVVLESPASFATSVMSQYNLSYFAKQPPANDFMAIGDDEGLFITVPPNRPWYPTSIVSKQYPTEVIFESNGGLHCISLNDARVMDGIQSKK